MTAARRRKRGPNVDQHPAAAPAAAAVNDEEANERGAASGTPRRASRSGSNASTPSEGSPCAEEKEALAMGPEELARKQRKAGVSPLRRPADAEPLPRDVPVAELQAMAEEVESRREEKKKKKGTGASNTTHNQYESAYRKWWQAFCEYAKWDKTELLNWLDKETGECNADGIFIQFFKFMHASPGMTYSPFKNAIFWAQEELNKQRRNRGLRELPEYICTLPGVKCL